MANNPQEPTTRLRQRLALFYASTFLALGVHMPFLPVWLTAKGLDAQTIGLVLAMPMILRLFAIPMATRAADRHDALRGVIMSAAAAALVGFAALGMAGGTTPIAILYALAATSFMPLFVLSDVYALRGLTNRRAYGPVRIWGSAAFIAANVAAGYLLDIIPAGKLIWLVVAGMGVCLAAACLLPPLAARAGGTSGPPARAMSLWRDPTYIAVGAAASLIQGSHALYYSFSTIDWQAQGYGGGTIGMLWALGVLAEIVLFAASPRLPAMFTPGVLLLIGACGAMLRWIAMALDPPAVALPLLQCLHGLSFGATHLGSLGYLARAAPAGLAATAQGYLAVTTGLAIAAATALSGLLYARFGAAAYAAMAFIAGAGVVAAFIYRRLER